jgi:L-asparagine transporter-like permease
LEDHIHRIKTIFIALAIVVVSVASFESITQAAQVTRINKNKGLIVINGSKGDGFVMGATVCFYSTSGEEITCGRIQQTSESYVTVKVNSREAKKIRNGMEAQLEDEGKSQE